MINMSKIERDEAVKLIDAARSMIIEVRRINPDRTDAELLEDAWEFAQEGGTVNDHPAGRADQWARVIKYLDAAVTPRKGAMALVLAKIDLDAALETINKWRR